MTEPQLRHLLARAADVPAPPDPWPDIRRGGHRLRRVRLAIAVTGVAAVAAIGISVPTLMRGQPVPPGRTGLSAPSAVPAVPPGPDMSSLAHGTWHNVPAPPSAAIQGAAMAWTGRELILWGGAGPAGPLPAGGLRTGYAYQPATDRWQTLPPAPVSTDGMPEAVWTGTDVVVAAPNGGQLQLAAYRPATGTWRRLPSPPVAGYSASGHLLTWTGRQLLLYGYPPETPAQARSPVQPQPQPVLAALTADGSQWRVLASPPSRLQHTRDQGFTTVWSGSRLLVFTQRMQVQQIPGGFELSPGGSTVTSYDPSANTWTTEAATGPAPPLNGTAFWTGRSALLVGGVECTECSRGPVGTPYPLQADVFDPATGSWHGLRPPSALNIMPQAVAWAGVLIAVVNASNLPGLPRQPAAAGVWDPDTGQWLRLPAPPVSVQGAGRISPVAGAWTGQEFIFPGSTSLVAFFPAS
jgi:N-acetylneuraminic acid mutarotase